MFDIVGTKSLDSNAVDFVEHGINFVGRTFENNGIQGKIKKQKFEPNEPFTITATVIGNYKYVKYQKEPYYCSQNINKLTPKPIFIKWSEKIAIFLMTNIWRFVSMYDGQQGGYKLDDIKNHKIKLPITASGEIDFEFMESFVAELEAERVAELEAYLAAASLKDYELTAAELSALSKFENYNWGEFRIGDLFIRLNTKKLPYKAKDLPVNVQDKFNLPCLTSSFNNQGLNYFAPRDGATILKNVISLPSNSDVYRGYFQSRDFTVLSDAYVIDWINKETKHKIQSYLFSLTSINKVTDLPIYSYKNKLGGWNVVRNKLIQLPINKDGDIDFEFMNNFIKAIEKLVIKDVVLYADNKIKATKSIVSSNQ